MYAVEPKKYQAIVIGTSAGGFRALIKVLKPLPRDLPVPVLVVRHQKADSNNYLIEVLNKESLLQISYAQDNVRPEPGHVYIAAPDCHLIVDQNGLLKTFSSEPVNYSRPSIDVLFKSAADYYKSELLAVLLTGANADGAEGFVSVKAQGGTVLVQDPDTAEADIMPKAAQKRVDVDHVIWLDQIGPKLWDLTRDMVKQK